MIEEVVAVVYRGNLRERFVCAVAVATLGLGHIAWPHAASNAGYSIPAPTAQKVARGVWLLRGGIPAGRQPDGNSVIFSAPEGLIVMDTGRHEWHRLAILALARHERKPIIAIINSHWHLDHVSGNAALRAQYPQLRVYASNAIDGALSGFLASSAEQAPAYLNNPEIPEDMRADIRGDLATIQNGAALRPDIVIDASDRVDIGGRDLRINLARYAATAGDVWLYDPTSGVAALGDLVTLPAPFLDTACPQGWKAALAEISATPFVIALPGHGPVLRPAQFALYRRAFESFIDCSNSARPKEECGADWTSSVGPLLAPGLDEAQRAKKIAAYYVDMLRANGGRSKYCEAPGSVSVTG
jgi:glyoxylase-like metal-dependent hydrolase (beta-lactamase superfamily II)